MKYLFGGVIMIDNEAWKAFEKTGKITDYINYKAIKNSVDSDIILNQNPIYTTNLNLRETNDNKNKGISN